VLIYLKSLKVCGVKENILDGKFTRLGPRVWTCFGTIDMILAPGNTEAGILGAK